ncbi:unnamed protein product [Brassicogethes aeneus]|uniref:SSD domain-containing protein n=1 Tax=Brassicogethes aeneus TaxID=1431903 RepID=A0A9P0BCA4_BRAAE|nr:unnamed protein product [Brassicogethes aeneus]
MKWFTNLLVHHPYVIIFIVLGFSGTCLIVPFTISSISFPRFQDPEMGFSTRGTTISNRLIAWTNLEKSTKPSGQFSINPKQVEMQRNYSISKAKQKKSGKKKKNKKTTSYEYGNIHVNEGNKTKPAEKVNKWKLLKEFAAKANNTQHFAEIKFIYPDGFFCGTPDERYAQLVIKSSDNKNLFTFDSLMALCHLENTFININLYRELCMEHTSVRKCCKPWSLANYIAILHNRASCLAITEEDINKTLTLLQTCSTYFHNFKLSSNCIDKGHCDAPKECTRHDAVFNILNFLTTTTFLSPKNETDSTKLYETMIFLPMACSTAALPFYHQLTKDNLEYDNLRVVAMNFGIKNALFDEYLVRDARLMISGAVFVFLCMWIYTQSLFLTCMTIIAIFFSMAISYFMYVLVFKIKFFPFMNLLATIVAIGIGADDAFIFCKIWHIQKNEKSISIDKLMTDTFRHAFFSMFVTSLTTTVAFLSSYVSSVTAVSCFSIFAGTAVVANYLLMMTWFPACVVLWERKYCSKIPCLESCTVETWREWCCSLFMNRWNVMNWPRCANLTKIWKEKENFLLEVVIKLKTIWLSLLLSIAVISAVIVLYYPRLKLPNSTEFQLFDSSHPFEQYDFHYKDHFWFKREEKTFQSSDISSSYKLPLRFVWGVLPVDNGDPLDPENLGTLTLDDTFNMSDPDSQLWLLNFCRSLRVQPFFKPMLGPLLPNCFIETFMKSMQKKCNDPFTHKDRSPCCETARFPFKTSVFDKCIIEEMAEIYAVPTEYLIPGMAGPKFSTDQFPTIKSIIVEYYSNYSFSLSYEQMNEFYNKVETWMQNELKTAPKGMKNGWFISVLEFYDLQRELSESTQIAIAMSMGLALVVLLLSTLNVFTSLYAILTITCSIFVVMAVLVLLGWKLNVLESVAVSTAIGLTVDFSLHYTVNYKMCPANIAQDRVQTTKYALSYMAGPALMAAITTGAAGAFMLPSLVLPYIQIGVVLVTVMTVSWIYATFFLGSLLATIGPQNQFGQFSYSKLSCYPFRRSDMPSNETNQPVEGESISDSHELEALTYKLGPQPAAKTMRRSSSTGANYTNSKYVFTDQSPSATSAITIIMADDN